jgi:hypothetical protein
MKLNGSWIDRRGGLVLAVVAVGVVAWTARFEGAPSPSNVIVANGDGEAVPGRAVDHPA